MIFRLKVASDLSTVTKTRKNGVAPKAEKKFLHDFRYDKQGSKKKSKKSPPPKLLTEDWTDMPGTLQSTPKSSKASARDVKLDDSFPLGYHSSSNSPQPSNLTQLDS